MKVCIAMHSSNSEREIRNSRNKLTCRNHDRRLERLETCASPPRRSIASRSIRFAVASFHPVQRVNRVDLHHPTNPTCLHVTIKTQQGNPHRPCGVRIQHRTIQVLLTFFRMRQLSFECKCPILQPAFLGGASVFYDLKIAPR